MSLEFWASARPTAEAVVDEEGSLTYGELAALASRYRRPGRYIYAARNSARSIGALLGMLTSRSTVALVDPLTVSEDLRAQVEDFSPHMVVADREFLERNGEVVGKAGHPVDEPLGEGERGLGEVVMYYAGIAGRTMQVVHRGEAVWRCAEALAAAMGLGRDDTVLVTPPATHVLGLVTMLAAIHVGARVATMARFNPARAIAMAEDATVIVGVPTMYAELVKAGVGKLRARFAVSGGAYLPPDVQGGFEEATGVRIVQLYGLTEALVVSFQPPELADLRGTVGLPLPWVEVRLAGDGELLVRSPWNMAGYSDPEDTERAFDGEWLRTGDVMAMDDRGLLYFRGVKKRMIKYKGYPIFPRDLEDLLRGHPSVADAKVVGEPDPEVGEVPVAYVVPRGPVRPEELMEYVNSRVAFYKKLRKVHLVDRTP